MRRALTAALVALAVSTSARAQSALDVLDPTPRAVLVHVEESSDLAAVGQTFGSGFPATYSVAGNTGSLVISAETHEQMRQDGFEPVAGTFTPIAIEIDLTTLEVASQPASGELTGSGGALSLAFTQNALDTTATGGFMGPDVSALFCTSQQQVDNACLINPVFCGQLCTLVPGSAYDPVTGRLNMIGSETQTGCDGAVCNGPFSFFTPRGDLLLAEGQSVPALPWLGAVALFSLLAGALVWGARARAR